MTLHRFFQVDVFTDTPFAGNPLAIFPEADDLDAGQMLALSREMNLSETSFVQRSDCATKRVRFFTPTAEVPLAGHPTIGTWWLLAEEELVDLPRNGDTRVTQETGAGVFPVDLYMKEGRPEKVIMTQASPQFGESLADITALGKALGGNEITVADGLLPQVVSTGLPQLMVPISSSEELAGLPSGGAGSQLAALLGGVGTDCAMCYFSNPTRPHHIRCRMFAPGLGVPEDPATGSASGALGAYLVWHGVVRPTNGFAHITVEQGVEIGRPSSIEVQVAVGNGGEITEVCVGGIAVTVIQGKVNV